VLPADFFSYLPGRIAAVIGASLVIQTDVFKSVGGFSDAFFVYGEDTDLCYRVRKAGWEIGYCETASVSHIGGHSEKSSTEFERHVRRQHGKYTFCVLHYPVDCVLKIARKKLTKSLRKLRINDHMIRLGFKSYSAEVQKHEVRLLAAFLRLGFKSYSDKVQKHEARMLAAFFILNQPTRPELILSLLAHNPVEKPKADDSV
jgi:GT2 family glycosyltransferase